MSRTTDLHADAEALSRIYSRCHEQSIERRAVQLLQAWITYDLDRTDANRAACDVAANELRGFYK